MKAIEKAKELVNKFIDYSDPTFEEEDGDGSLHLTFCAIEQFNNAIKCALICVEEIIENISDISTYGSSVELKWRERMIYWEEVKQEIEKL